MRAVLTCSVALLCVFVGLGAAAAAETGQVIERSQFAAPDPLPVQPASVVVSDSSEGCEGCQAGYASTDGGCGCGKAGCRGCGSCCLGSTCDMGQRYPYFPPMHGYYYFRPYHHSHVRNHQAIVQAWGEDPANPYANRIFQTVYEQVKAESPAPPAPAAK